MRGLVPHALRSVVKGVVDWIGSCLPGGAARREARDSQARLTLALEAAGMAIWEMDAESGDMWWSPRAGALFGSTDGTETMRTRLPHVVQRIHPEDRARFQAAVAEAVARTGEVHRIQARVVWPDGQVRWLEARGQSWVASDGRLRGLRGTLVDLTESKKVEEDLRRNLEELGVITAVAECAADASDEETLLTRTTEILRDSFFPESCGFFLLDEGDGLLHPAPSFHTRRPPGEPGPVEGGQGIVGEVASTGEARQVDDVRDEGDVVCHAPGTRSLLCVPLKAGGRVIGVLDAGSRHEAAFSARDQGLLVLVASHVATALERLRGEEALRRSSEMYQAYFTASPLAVFVSDARGRYLEVNGAATALTGYSRAELLGMAIPDLLAVDGAAEVRSRLAGLLALGAGRSEIQIRRKDGSVRHCILHATAIGDDSLLGFLLDITDRRDAEEKVKESEERFRGLSEASFEAILIHDDGRIVDVNHAFCELTGYSWHEVIGRDGFDLIVPEDREAVYRTLLAEYDRPYEITGLRRDGTPLPLEIQARSFPFRGRVLRVVAMRDVSERRQAEEVQRSLIRDLEVKNAELERFAHTVSHDLKAPVITIRGFAAHLLRDLHGGRTERLQDDLRRIGEAAVQMGRILDHLVELSRAGEAAGTRVPVDLGSVAREALARVEERRPKGLAGEVSVSIEEGLPIVLGDRKALVQVLQHLIDNAVKFSADVNEPAVSVEVAGRTSSDATVVVRDNGRGIDPAHHERVFGLFERLDPAVEGAGVGLAVVKRIVGIHGGRVGLASRGTGCGTEVWVRLPVPAVVEAAGVVAATEGVSLPSVRRSRAGVRRGT